MTPSEAMQKWREKNARSKQAIPVEIDGVGTVYVRAISISDAEYIQGLSDLDGSSHAFVMTGLFCDENGDRLNAEQRAEWLEIFRDATWQDYLDMSSAARGVISKKADDSGN